MDVDFNNADLIFGDMKKKEDEREEEFLPEDFLIIEYKQNGDVKSKKVDINKVTEQILSNNNFKTIYGKRAEEIYFYEGGIWVLRGREIIETECERLLKDYSNSHSVSEILQKIKRKTTISREDFDNIPKEVLPLKNGILNFKTREFSEYSPEYYFKTKLPINYNPNSECNKWLNFIKETFYPEDIPIIQEWFGFCHYRDYFIKKGLIGVGEADTGKSVFQNVLFKYFGNQNISGLNLQKITKDNNFSKSSLYNKYVNIYDDMSSKDINDGGGFKMVTGRSPITAEYKFNDEFQFINFAKMTFCCNKIPPIKDTDDITYYNRWLPIPFDNVVPEEYQDKFLIDKLTTQEELSGILNWALEGLKRLLDNGRFSYNKSPEEIKSLMDRSSHPLAEFVDDCLEEGDNKITKEVMFKIYQGWAILKNKPRETKEKLGRDLPRYAKFIIDGRGGGKIRYWDKIKIKDNDTCDTIIQKVRDEDINDIYYIVTISKKVSHLSDFNNSNSNKEDFTPKVLKPTFSSPKVLEVLENTQKWEKEVQN